MEINIKSGKEEYENLVICFHGPGLVGAIVGEYFAEYGRFKYIGYVEDKNIPPASVIINGKVYPTMRFYESDRNLLLIIDQDFSGKLIYEMADKIKKLVRDKNIKRIVMINGIEDTQRRIFYISNKEEVKGALKLMDGVITGLPSVLLMDKRLNVVFILGGVYSPDIDPEASLKVVDFLKGFIGEEIDLQPLMKEIEEFSKMFKDIEIEKKKRIPIQKSLYG